jgi:4-hydroxy-tetrahydrodipicolinate reductase
MATSDDMRIVQYGLGPIGQEAARAVLDKADAGPLELAGAIDIDPDKAGRDVAALLERDAPTGVAVSDDAARTLAEARPDVVLHTTSSFLNDDVQGQLTQCVEAGACVVSSTEELAFPYDRHPGRAAALDEAAQQNGVVIVGTGVNPGYAMDTLALAATGACVEVEKVQVERVVDAGERRGPLQRKVGAGLSRVAFEEKRAADPFGHVGLRESLQMVASSLGWPLGDISETLQPVMADGAHETPHVSVEEGSVAGLHHTVAGSVGGQERLSLDLKMYVGAREPRDAVRVTGAPPIDLVAQGGIFGDTATVAALINTAGLAARTEPGLRTMARLPVPRAFATAPAQHASPASEQR